MLQSFEMESGPRIQSPDRPSYLESEPEPAVELFNMFLTKILVPSGREGRKDEEEVFPQTEEACESREKGEKGRRPPLCWRGSKGISCQKQLFHPVLNFRVNSCG